MKWVTTGLLFCIAAKAPDILTMSAEQQKTVGLRTVQAERRPIVEPIELPGTVAFDPRRVAILRTQAAARVLRIGEGPGDTVHAGESLATLAMPGLLDAQAKLRTARASLREAEAGVAAAQAALHRAEILSREGSLARAVAEQRRVLLAQQQAGAAAARADLVAESAEIARLGPSADAGIGTLTSPIDGTVVSAMAAPGEWLDAGIEVFQIADLSTMLIVAQLTERQAALVVVGDSADIRPEAGERVWHGRVLSLGPAVDPQSRLLPARILVANPDRVLHGSMFVTVTITSNRGRESVVVPDTAVQRVGDAAVVFAALGDNRFRRCDLTLGVQQPGWVEIRSGIDAGQTVVTQGSFTLKAMLQKALLGGAG